VFLAEPPPSQGDIRFTLLGFPVRIHPFFWLTTLLLGMSGDKDPLHFLMWVAAVLLCILLHELGHALVMRAYGYDASIVLHSFGGLAIPRAGRVGFRQPGPVGQILISLAGPASGFILAALLVLGLHYVGGYMVAYWYKVVPVVGIPGHSQVETLLNDIFQVAVLWGLVNLLPVFPLDGGQVAANVFALFNPQDAMRQALILSVVVGGLMAFVAFFQWQDMYVGILFIWLTYSNFSSLQQSRMW
jgi:stage IV sporulation protein FB